jgi:hypothetical protein
MKRSGKKSPKRVPTDLPVRAAFRDMLEQDGMEAAYRSNVAMLLHDRYGITDHRTRNAAASEILALICQDDYLEVQKMHDKARGAQPAPVEPFELKYLHLLAVSPATRKQLELWQKDRGTVSEEWPADAAMLNLPTRMALDELAFKILPLVNAPPVHAEPAREIDIVFDGPPSHESGRFVEVERDGKSIRIGRWFERDDGLWVLRIPLDPRTPTERMKMAEELIWKLFVSCSTNEVLSRELATILADHETRRRERR